MFNLFKKKEPVKVYHFDIVYGKWKVSSPKKLWDVFLWNLENEKYINREMLL